MSLQTHDIPDTCLAALFQGPGLPLELCELPVPKVGPGEALVRVDCCTICGSDLHTYTGARTEPTPSILGHEIVGVVADVGDPPLHDLTGTPLQQGDRVTWSTTIACGECDRCRQGIPQKCRKLAKYGHEQAAGREALSGGLAEFILLRPGTSAVKLDAELRDEVICPVNCATATVAAAYRTADRTAEQRVLIFGAGMLGLTAAAFAKVNGASHVVVCDTNPSRLEQAKRFGADRVALWDDQFEGFQQRLSVDTQPALFDVILELSGAPVAVEAACRLGDVAARVVLVGTVMTSRPVQVDPEQVVRRWLSIYGVHNYAPRDLQTAVAFLERSHTEFPFAQLVEQTYPLKQVNQALDVAARERPVRVAIRPRSESAT